MSELKVEIEGGKSQMVESLQDGSFLVDGEEKKLDIKVLGDKKFHIIQNHQSYSAEVLKADYQDKSFQIRVNNNLYELKVEDRFDLLLQKLGMEDLAAAGVTELKAPMPGLVLSIEVEAGQEVKQDEPLIVLEAMKMENVLKAPADVVVKSVAVEKSQAVEKNQLLIEFES
ncbi:MAG: biotin/lipoyl-containing protein [Vicingaceae bacterium]